MRKLFIYVYASSFSSPMAGKGSRVERVELDPWIACGGRPFPGFFMIICLLEWDLLLTPSLLIPAMDSPCG